MTYSPVRLGATGVTRVLTNLSYGDLITNAYNLVGGVASASSLNVSGFSTFTGIVTTIQSVYVGTGQTLFTYDAVVSNQLTVQTASYTDLIVTGVGTFSNPIYYQSPNFSGPNGIAYFNGFGQLVSGINTASTYTDTSNFLLTIDEAGTPVWSGVLDGGEY